MLFIDARSLDVVDGVGGFLKFSQIAIVLAAFGLGEAAAAPLEWLLVGIIFNGGILESLQIPIPLLHVKIPIIDFRGGGFDPSPQLGVAIGEGKSAAVRVAARRGILPIPDS